MLSRIGCIVYFKQQKQKRLKNALQTVIKYVVDVVKTFERHLEGIFNAILYKKTSAQQERINGNIQSIIAKARGFANFERFRINVMSYYGKNNIHTKFRITYF